MSFVKRLPSHLPTAMVLLARLLFASTALISSWPLSNLLESVLVAIIGGNGLLSLWIPSRLRGWFDALSGALCILLGYGDLTVAFVILAITDVTQQNMQTQNFSWLALCLYGVGAIIMWQGNFVWAAIAIIVLGVNHTLISLALSQDRKMAEARQKELLAHQEQLRYQLDELAWTLETEQKLNIAMKSLLDRLLSDEAWDECVAEIAQRLTGARHLGIYFPGNPWSLRIVKSAIPGEHPPFPQTLTDDDVTRLKLGEYLSCYSGDGRAGIYVLAYRKEIEQDLRIPGEYTRDDYEILRRFLNAAISVRDLMGSSS